jgi:hypothetical protein
VRGFFFFESRQLTRLAGELPVAAWINGAPPCRQRVLPEDPRFLMIRPVRGGTADKLVVVDNWLEELKAKSQQ